MADIELRPIARADVRSLSKVLARAFYDDPVMKYMLPDDKAQGEGTAAHVRDAHQESLHRPRRLRGGQPRRGDRCGHAVGSTRPTQVVAVGRAPDDADAGLALPLANRADQDAGQADGGSSPRGTALVPDGDRQRPVGAGRRLRAGPDALRAWTAATANTPRPTSRPARNRWSRTTAGSGSSRSARSTFPTVRR